MRYFKNVNIEEIEQLNAIWVEKFRKDNPTDMITTGYVLVETHNGINYIVADDETCNWGLSNEIVDSFEEWYEPACKYQIKIGYKDLVGLINDIPAMVEYKSTLPRYETETHVYYYVNYFDGMDRQMLEYYGGIVTERENI